MRYEFHPEALQEFSESAAYYETRRQNLGVEFAREIESALRQIADAPLRWPFIEEDVRRRITHRFPYCVLYTVEIDYILIIAVMHGSRKPGYWRNRISNRIS